jgi:hypothetical protein
VPQGERSKKRCIFPFVLTPSTLLRTCFVEA